MSSSFHASGEPGGASPHPQFDSGSAWGIPPTREMPPVMVIDDSYTVRRVIEASFSRVGVPIISYPDGITALHALLHHETPTPDLILLDIGLPKMNGYEVAQLLRQHPEFENTKIIMMTGRDGVVDRMRSKLVGARDFIGKPFKTGDLVARVCKHLGIAIPGVTSRRPHTRLDGQF